MANNTILIEPYLLGCLIGDGGLHGNLTFASKDFDIINRVNDSLTLYGYHLVKRSLDKKRDSEYSICPIKWNSIKYNFIYKNNTYSTKDLLTLLQSEGYPITSLDTLKSITKISTRTKKSTILKYFPELEAAIKPIIIKETQKSSFLANLDYYHLRVRFDEKRIPEEYFKADFDCRLKLFQGLMDTDGCGSGHHLEFCVSNKLLAEDIKALAETLGYQARIVEKMTKYFNKKYNEYRFGKLAYRVYFNNLDTICPFLCKRKIDNYLKK